MDTSPLARAFDRHVGSSCPGAAIEVRRAGDILFRRTGGLSSVPGYGIVPVPVTEATRFDLASLTKPLVTAMLVAMYIDRGVLPRNATIADFCGGAFCGPKAAISIEKILCHSAGFVPWLPFAERLTCMWGTAVAGTAEARRECLSAALEWPLSVGAGHGICYSDVGYILLGLLIEKMSGRRLADLFADMVTNPLGLQSTGFRPVQAATGAVVCDDSDFAATSFCPVRKRVACGEVHDLNAWIVGGAAGHAGLFSSIVETADLVDEWIAAVRNESLLIGGETACRFVFGDTGAPGGMRTPGFDRPSGIGSMAGDGAPSGTVGHLGFTGTSFWFDRMTGLSVVLLTNRSNPEMYGRMEGIRNMRREIHDCVWETFREA